MKNNTNSLENIKVGDSLIWRHIKLEEYKSMYNYEKLYKEVKVLSINNGFVKTNFGTYNIKTGKNQFGACGCKRFCDCYGVITTK